MTEAAVLIPFEWVVTKHCSCLWHQACLGNCPHPSLNSFNGCSLPTCKNIWQLLSPSDVQILKEDRYSPWGNNRKPPRGRQGDTGGDTVWIVSKELVVERSWYKGGTHGARAKFRPAIDFSSTVLSRLFAQHDFSNWVFWTEQQPYNNSGTGTVGSYLVIGFFMI